MPAPISNQLNSLREQMKDGNNLSCFSKLADAGFAGVEVARLYGMDPRQVR